MDKFKNTTLKDYSFLEAFILGYLYATTFTKIPESIRKIIEKYLEEDTINKEGIKREMKPYIKEYYETLKKEYNYVEDI